MTVHQPYSHPGTAHRADWEPAELGRGASGAGFFTQVGYGMLWALVILAGLAGAGFAAYRNDVLLTIAERAGNEKGYLAWEKRVLGEPGWGTPRSVRDVARSATLSAPNLEASSATLSIDRAVPGSVVARSAPEPSTPALNVAPPAPLASASPPAGPAQAAAAPSAEREEALPERGTRRKSRVRERETGSSSPRESRAVARNAAPVRNKPTPASKRVPVEDVELEEEEAPVPKKASRAVAKSEPEQEREDEAPAPKPEPKAKPEPKTKQSTAKVALPPPGDDDSPLKAAIRAAIVADQK